MMARSSGRSDLRLVVGLWRRIRCALSDGVGVGTAHSEQRTTSAQASLETLRFGPGNAGIGLGSGCGRGGGRGLEGFALGFLVALVPLGLLPREADLAFGAIDPEDLDLDVVADVDHFLGAVDLVV